jgi:hypothetical protein
MASFSGSKISLAGPAQGPQPTGVLGAHCRCPRKWAHGLWRAWTSEKGVYVANAPPSDAGEESSGLRLEEVEYGVVAL